MGNIIKGLLALFLVLVPATGYATGPTFSQGFTATGPVSLNQGAQHIGSLYVQAIADPSAPTVTVNTTGSASHSYYIVGHDGAASCGSGHEGTSNVSSPTTASNSSSPQNNTITLPTAYSFYDVLRDATNTSIATCVAGGSSVVDTGQSTSAYTAPNANTTGGINISVLRVTGPINVTGNAGNGSDFLSSVRVNGYVPPEGFTGANYWAKIQAAENWCVATQTLNTCVIDASANLLSKTASGTTRLVLSKPTLIRLQGNLDYTGAGNAAGAIEFASGSDGSELTCTPSGLDENDGVYNFGEGGSSNFTKQVSCSISAELSSATGNPLIVIDSGVSRIYIHDINLQGDSTITDGITNLGRDGTQVRRVSFTHERPSGTPSNPTGWAYRATSAQPQNAQVLQDNIVVAWTSGFSLSNTGGGSNIGVKIDGNIFVLTAGEQLLVHGMAASTITRNQFLSMFPTVDNQKKIEFDAIDQNILFQSNHSECSNQTAKNGIVDVTIDSTATMRSNNFSNNSLHGNVGCNVSSTFDSDHNLDWQATAGWNNFITGNDFAGNLNGAINLASGSFTTVERNNVKAPGNGETTCTAEPGPGTGCLLVAASALPTGGQEDTPLHQSGLLGALTGGSSTLLEDCTTMNNSGVLTLMTLVTDLGGSSCTTAPTYNIRNNTQALLGTGHLASNTTGIVTQAESLTYAPGDQICLVKTVAGATCATAGFSISAQSKRID